MNLVLVIHTLETIIKFSQYYLFSAKKEFVLKVLSLSTSRNRMPLVDFFQKNQPPKICHYVDNCYFVDFNTLKILFGLIGPFR